MRTLLQLYPGDHVALLAAYVLVQMAVVMLLAWRARDEGGAVVSAATVEQRLDADRRRLVRDAKQRSVIASLVELSAVDDEFDIERFIDYLRKRGAFTPKQLATLIWRLGEHDIEYTRSYFKMTIRRRRERRQFREMEDWQLDKIWPCLSPSQRRWCHEHRMGADSQ